MITGLLIGWAGIICGFIAGIALRKRLDRVDRRNDEAIQARLIAEKAYTNKLSNELADTRRVLARTAAQRDTLLQHLNGVPS